MRISDWSSDVCSSDLPLAEITAHDRLYGGFERAYAAQRTTAQQIATDQSGDQRQRQGPQQALAQDHVDLVDNAGRTRQHQQLSVRSEEHTSELQSLMRISYAVFCLKKKTKQTTEQEKHKRRKAHKL